jgi:hypothetical protein
MWEEPAVAYFKAVSSYPTAQPQEHRHTQDNLQTLREWKKVPLQ